MKYTCALPVASFEISAANIFNRALTWVKGIIQILSENPNQIRCLSPFSDQFGKHSLEYIVNDNSVSLAILGPFCACESKNPQMAFEAK